MSTLDTCNCNLSEVACTSRNQLSYSTRQRYCAPPRARAPATAPPELAGLPPMRRGGRPRRQQARPVREEAQEVFVQRCVLQLQIGLQRVLAAAGVLVRRARRAAGSGSEQPVQGACNGTLPEADAALLVVVVISHETGQIAVLGTACGRRPARRRREPRGRSRAAARLGATPHCALSSACGTTRRVGVPTSIAARDSCRRSRPPLALPALVPVPLARPQLIMRAQTTRAAQMIQAAPTTHSAPPELGAVLACAVRARPHSMAPRKLRTRSSASSQPPTAR